MGPGQVDRVNVALVGGGIMSATLGNLIAQLMPEKTIAVFERLKDIALESTQAMNNAGTGHAGNCELNYTPEGPDGTIDVAKALRINGAFETSLQFWSTLVERGLIVDPREFIHPVPHMAFVWGDENVAYLRRRHDAMSAHPMYADMAFSSSPEQLREWAPLIMAGRAGNQPVAATRVSRGTDVDYGQLTKALFAGLDQRAETTICTNTDVSGLRRSASGGWQLTVRDHTRGETRTVVADFVFLGAGGGALPLLQKSGIPEARGYGGFPVSGQWLICSNQELVGRHAAKVYGKAALGAPPMSVPHLDTRYWKGQPALLFGPFAGFTTRYLRTGSSLDLFRSIKGHNLGPMLTVAKDNWDLTRYLIGQATQSQSDRMSALRDYHPEARDEDWSLAIAGYRVQIIKRNQAGKGILQFGTEVVAAGDGSLAALLGASPGASTAADIMLGLLKRCFPANFKDASFVARLQDLVPSFGADLASDHATLARLRSRADTVLKLG